MPRVANPPPQSSSRYSTLVGQSLEKQQEPIQNVQLFVPFEAEQMNLAEYASYLASKTYLYMCKIPFSVEYRSNAEFMGSHGQTTNCPFFRVDSFLGSEFKPLVKILEDRGVILSGEMNPDEHDELRTYVTLIHEVFTNAELFILFRNEEVYEKVTKPRIEVAYPYLLGKVASFKKRRQALKILELNEYAKLTPSKVFDKVEHCCRIIEDKLQGHNYVCGDKPTELDAVLFGHLYAIWTTQLPNTGLHQVIKKYPTLIDLVQRIERKFFTK